MTAIRRLSQASKCLSEVIDRALRSRFPAIESYSITPPKANVLTPQSASFLHRDPGAS